MQQRCSSCCTCVLLFVLLPVVAFAESATYHLHKEASNTSGLLQLKTIGPDAGSVAFTLDLKKRPADEYLVKAFDTAPGSPNVAGVIPAGSVVSVLLWMRKTADVGSMYPRAKVRLNSASGSAVCDATGTSPLTTTLVATTMSCTTTANVVMSASDRFYVWVGVNLVAAPGNTPVKVELRVEGTINGNFDSRITVPVPAAAPVINGLWPASGPVGTAVTIAGANFGAVQSDSAVTFNGVAAAPSAWNATSITTPVPVGASTGSVLVTVQGLSSNAVPFTVEPIEPAGPVSYAYDALGRLVQVTSASGHSAIYRYDAVGNILAIDRPGSPGSNPIVISGFAPSHGPVDTAVAVTGAGFSSAPSENAVTFNGTAASVTSATATQLVAIVPAGATSGPIGVTSPGGSASSASAFTVLSNNGAPGITRVTPSIGVTGTPFTITGTNFEGTRANNRVTLNIRPADVTAADSTTLVTTVPLAAMGGRITVATPSGTAVSADDFVVVPSPYTPGDVESAQRIAPGESRTASVSTGGRIALLLFDGTAGEFATVTSTSSTWTSCQFGGQYGLTLYGPDAALLTLVTNACGATTLMDHLSLPLTGTYTLMLDPNGSYTGSATIALYTSVDVVGTITADGTPVAAATTTPGQHVRLAFSGTAGQIVSAVVSDATFPGNCLSYAFSLSLLKPDGTTLAWAPSCGGSVFMDQRALPVSGTYTLLLDPGWTGTGTATVRLYTVSDVVAPIAADGTRVPVSLTTPGQNARFTFDGSAGQVVSALVTNATIPGNCVSYAFYITLLRPDGSTLKSVPSCGGSGFLDRQTLPVSGNYTLMLDPGGTSTGNAIVALYTIVDVTGPITDGSGIPVSITAPGQNARFTFAGTPGQVVSGLVSNATIPGNCVNYAFYLMLLRPDGSTQSSAVSCGGGVFLDRQTLSTTGTYTLMLDPIGANTGNATVALYTVVDVTGSIVANGASVPVSVTAPGQNVRLTFGGTAGQVVSVSTSNSTIPGNCVNYALYLSIVKPDGSTLASTPSCSGNASLGQRTLPVSGTYTIVVDPTGANTGSITLTLTSP